MTKAPRAPRSEGRAFARHDLRQARLRFALSIAAGVVVAAALGTSLGGAVRAVAGWDAFTVVNLAVSWWIIARADATETKRRAASEDPGRHVVWALVLASCTFSLFAAVVVMRRAKALAPEQSTLLVALCLIAVTGAWALTHTAYTLRYAHLYYGRGDAEAGGLSFPGDAPPDDFDFAYFAFTIGMCFQVSDVTIARGSFRRAVMGHALLSFAFNTAVLALSLNLIFGILG